MIQIPFLLFSYIGRHFLLAVLSVLAIMLTIVGLVELIEMLRRAADTAHGVPFFLVLEMAALKLPTTAEKIYPFAFLIGGMMTFSRLTRSNELAVVRAVGVSVWQFLLPCVTVSLLTGLFFVGIMSPISSATISRYERLEGKYISNRPSLLTISASGIWLRQVEEKNLKFMDIPVSEYILHALRMDPNSLKMQWVSVLMFNENHAFVGRVDADEAVLQEGYWSMPNALLSSQTQSEMLHPVYTMPTQLTVNQIQDSFSPPETFSFWQLPSFIALLEQSGFSALRHKLHFHSLMALPVLLVGMVLLSAVFSLRQVRRGRTGGMMAMGLGAGFFLYFTTNVIYALGASGGLPVILAAWAPSLMVMMFAGSALLHLEDG